MNRILIYLLAISSIFFGFNSSYAGFFDYNDNTNNGNGYYSYEDNNKKSESQKKKNSLKNRGFQSFRSIISAKKMKDCMMKAKSKDEIIQCRKRWLKYNKEKTKPYRNTIEIKGNR